jgi:hypothetical protein
VTSPPRVLAILADKSCVVGTVFARGGMLGSAVLHLPKREAAQHVLGELARVQRLAARGRRTGWLEPKRGHVAMYPRFCAAEDGDRVLVPLRGTRFEVHFGTGR